MANYSFIFARGGSKGLPRKNVKLLNGKPLIQYSIETALKSPSVEKVFVSTEDEEIGCVAERCGAIVIQRPPELATDTASEWLAWQHAVGFVLENVGDFDLFISLPTTSPLRSVDDVERAISKLHQTNADACISVTPAVRSPYFNMVKQIQGTGFCELVNKVENSLTRRQDAPEIFDITTVVYATRPSFILNNNGLFSGNVTSVEVPKERSVDIDDIYDFMLAEAILSVEKNQL